MHKILETVLFYLDMISLLLAIVVEHISFGSIWNKENGFEGNFTFSVEMSSSHGGGGILNSSLIPAHVKNCFITNTDIFEKICI